MSEAPRNSRRPSHTPTRLCLRRIRFEEEAIYNSQALRNFVGIDLSLLSVPDATTLLKFRRLLEPGGLTKKLFEEINTHLHQQGLVLRASEEAQRPQWRVAMQPGKPKLPSDSALGQMIEKMEKIKGNADQLPKSGTPHACLKSSRQKPRRP